MRTIPSQLLDALDSPVMTLAWIVRIATKRARDGEVAPRIFGLAELDKDVNFDDGRGAITYQHLAGVTTTAIVTDRDVSVDNSSASIVLDWDVEAITAEQLAAGELDGAEFDLYLVDYETGVGSKSIMSGELGQVRSIDGLSAELEFRGWTQRFKQSVIELYSISCRTEFGSPQCGVNAELLWVNATITDIGLESDLTFTVDTLPSGLIVPGLVNFLDGQNANVTREIASVTGNVIELAFETPYPITQFTSVRIRPDCAKHFQTWCITIYNNGINFQGEPLIAVSQQDASVVPGASIPGSSNQVIGTLV